MIRLSVSIMAHPIRSHNVNRLLTDLGNFPDVQVCYDVDNLGIWGNAKNAWMSFDSSCTHHLVLQDDVVVCKDLIASIPEIIKFVPATDSISLCSNHPDTESVDKYGLSWLRNKNVRHGQALIQPVPQIMDWINWCEWNVRPEYRFDDGRLEMYIRDHSRWVWNTVPSLVEHDDQGSVDSQLKLLKKTSDTYSSYRFIGADSHPLDIDWSRGVDHPFTKRGDMRPTERWAMGRDAKNIGRNEINEHAVPDRKSIHRRYDDVMAVVRDNFYK